MFINIKQCLNKITKEFLLILFLCFQRQCYHSKLRTMLVIVGKALSMFLNTHKYYINDFLLDCSIAIGSSAIATKKKKQITWSWLWISIIYFKIWFFVYRGEKKYFIPWFSLNLLAYFSHETCFTLFREILFSFFFRD